jgi:hypothetical protein
MSRYETLFARNKGEEQFTEPLKYLDPGHTHATTGQAIEPK